MHIEQCIDGIVIKKIKLFHLANIIEFYRIIYTFIYFIYFSSRHVQFSRNTQEYFPENAQSSNYVSTEIESIRATDCSGELEIRRNGASTRMRSFHLEFTGDSKEREFRSMHK